jgi:hypothetical protein
MDQAEDRGDDLAPDATLATDIPDEEARRDEQLKYYGGEKDDLDDEDFLDVDRGDSLELEGDEEDEEEPEAEPEAEPEVSDDDSEDEEPDAGEEEEEDDGDVAESDSDDDDGEDKDRRDPRIPLSRFNEVNERMKSAEKGWQS